MVVGEQAIQSDISYCKSVDDCYSFVSQQNLTLRCALLCGIIVAVWQRDGGRGERGEVEKGYLLEGVGVGKEERGKRKYFQAAESNSCTVRPPSSGCLSYCSLVVFPTFTTSSTHRLCLLGPKSL